VIFASFLLFLLRFELRRLSGKRARIRLDESKRYHEVRFIERDETEVGSYSD